MAAWACTLAAAMAATRRGSPARAAAAPVSIPLPAADPVLCPVVAASPLAAAVPTTPPLWPPGAATVAPGADYTAQLFQLATAAQFVQDRGVAVPPPAGPATPGRQLAPLLPKPTQPAPAGSRHGMPVAPNGVRRTTSGGSSASPTTAGAAAAEAGAPLATVSDELQRRRERNRAASARSRQRRKAYTEELSTSVQLLRQRRDALRVHVEQLRRHNALLRTNQAVLDAVRTRIADVEARTGVSILPDMDAKPPPAPAPAPAPLLPP